MGIDKDYQRVDYTEYQNVQKAFDTVKERIIDSDTRFFVNQFNTESDTYRLIQYDNQNTERSE
jgi:hypothetical protein